MSLSARTVRKTTIKSRWETALSARTELETRSANYQNCKKWISPRAQRAERSQKSIINVLMALSARTARELQSNMYRKCNIGVLRAHREKRDRKCIENK
jgi:hypothetical protein